MISPLQGLYLHTEQHEHRINTHNTDIRALSTIRTQDFSVRASEDSSCLRPRGHCDRRDTRISEVNESSRRNTSETGLTQKLLLNCSTTYVMFANARVRICELIHLFYYINIVNIDRHESERRKLNLRALCPLISFPLLYQKATNSYTVSYTH
jgi:hypothetical protein